MKLFTTIYTNKQEVSPSFSEEKATHVLLSMYTKIQYLLTSLSK